LNTKKIKNRKMKSHLRNASLGCTILIVNFLLLLLFIIIIINIDIIIINNYYHYN